MRGDRQGGASWGLSGGGLEELGESNRDRVVNGSLLRFLHSFVFYLFTYWMEVKSVCCFNGVLFNELQSPAD